MFPLAGLWNAHIDTGIGMKVSSDSKRFGAQTDIKGFSGLFTFFVLLVSLYLGLRAFEKRELMKSYKSIKGNFAFFPIIVSRYAKVLIVTVGIISISIIQCTINNVLFFESHFLIFLLILILTALLFLFFGLILDEYFRRKKIPLSIIFYLTALFLLPMQMDEILRYKCDSLFAELNNLKLLMGFEDRFYNKFGRVKDGDPPKQEVIDMIESGQKNEYKKMIEKENALIDKLEKHAKKKHLLSSIFPGVFLLNFNREISGGGYMGLLQFTKFTQETRGKFIRYYITKKFYEEAKRGEVIAFSGNNILKSNGNYPFYLLSGIILLVGFNILSLYIAYLGFKNLLVKVKRKKRDAMRELKITLKKEMVTDFFTKNELLKDHIFLEFAVKSRAITISDEPMRRSFIYLPEICFIPKGFEKLLGIENISGELRWRNLLEAALKTNDIVLTSWKISRLPDCNQIKDVAKNGTLMNISDDIIDSAFAENRLKWDKDETIRNYDPYLLASFFQNSS
jgi:hypothetical protein